VRGAGLGPNRPAARASGCPSVDRIPAGQDPGVQPARPRCVALGMMPALAQPDGCQCRSAARPSSLPGARRLRGPRDVGAFRMPGRPALWRWASRRTGPERPRPASRIAAQALAPGPAAVDRRRPARAVPSRLAFRILRRLLQRPPVGRLADPGRGRDRGASDGLRLQNSTLPRSTLSHSRVAFQSPNQQNCYHAHKRMTFWSGYSAAQRRAM